MDDTGMIDMSNKDNITSGNKQVKTYGSIPHLVCRSALSNENGQEAECMMGQPDGLFYRDDSESYMMR
jgi:hypothetical protein